MIEKIEKVAEREVLPTNSLQQHFRVMPRQDPREARKAHEPYGHLRRRGIVFRQRELVNSAGRKSQRDAGAKTYDLLGRRRAVTNGLPLRKNPFQESNRLKEIKPRTLFKKSVG